MAMALTQKQAALLQRAEEAYLEEAGQAGRGDATPGANLAHWRAEAQALQKREERERAALERSRVWKGGLHRLALGPLLRKADVAWGRVSLAEVRQAILEGQDPLRHVLFLAELGLKQLRGQDYVVSG